jgi:putative SOS response-associated peptidase YedK
MCTRFSFAASKEKMKKQFGLNLRADLQQSYNIGAGQNAYVLTKGSSELQIFRWGLIPNWAKEESVGKNLINANAEGISTAFSFRMPIRQRRCLIFADSYYEWIKQIKGNQAYRILPKDQSIIAFAGIWDSWLHPDERLIKSFSIITTTANANLRTLNERMPVLLIGAEAQQLWLSEAPLEEILPLLQPCPADYLQYYPIAPAVDQLSNNYPDLHKSTDQR